VLETSTSERLKKYTPCGKEEVEHCMEAFRPVWKYEFACTHLQSSTGPPAQLFLMIDIIGVSVAYFSSIVLLALAASTSPSRTIAEIQQHISIRGLPDNVASHWYAHDFHDK